MARTLQRFAERMNAGDGRESDPQTGANDTNPRLWNGQAAAGAAEGALGRDRPAASGSSCRWNAADQDFSRSATARPVSGRAVTAAAILAPCARKAASMPVSATAASAIRPDADGVGAA